MGSAKTAGSSGIIFVGRAELRLQKRRFLRGGYCKNLECQQAKNQSYGNRAEHQPDADDPDGREKVQRVTGH